MTIDSLSTLLEITNKDIVTLIGAGGKTSTMFYLAEELTKQNKSVLITTTTKMFPPDKKYKLILTCELESAVLEVQNVCSAGVSVFLGHHFAEQGKIGGIPPEWAFLLMESGAVNNILIEGDGAKSKSFKAHGEKEPIIPLSTTKVVMVVGISVIGKALNQRNVHRQELVSELAGVPLGCTITTNVVARVLTHPRTLAKIPVSCKLFVLINQIDDQAKQDISRELSEEILMLANGRIENVLMAGTKGGQTKLFWEWKIKEKKNNG